MLDSQRADFGLFVMLVEKDPLDAVLKGKGVQEGWTCFKKEFFSVLKQAILMCQKTSQQGRSSAWMNRALAGTQGESASSLEEGPGNSGRLQGCCEVMQGEN